MMHGHSRPITDVCGNVVKVIQYDSFGNILSDSNPSMNLPFKWCPERSEEMPLGYRRIVRQ